MYGSLGATANRNAKCHDLQWMSLVGENLLPDIVAKTALNHVVVLPFSTWLPTCIDA